MKQAITIFVLASLAWAASAQVPIEDEFLVNDAWRGDQRHPSVAADGKGRFLVVWQDQESNEILIMRYTDGAQPRGAEIRVSPLTLEEHVGPEVAMNAKGRFVSVWESLARSGAGAEWRVSAQPFRRNGRALGKRVEVNEGLVAEVASPDVAMSRRARFVVVWAEAQVDGSGLGILARRFKKNGRADGLPFLVNTHADGDQFEPAVATDDAGNFVVVWSSRGQDGDRLGIFGQRFRANGLPVGEEFRVSTRTSRNQHRPAVAVSGSGAYVVVWESQLQDGSGAGIFGQRFLGNGDPLDAEFLVNSFTRSDQSAPAVAMDRSGAFVVAWSCWALDGDKWGVFGQQFGSDGLALGEEFQINQVIDEDQGGVISVEFGRSGEYVASWMSEEQDGDDFGIFARRFDLERSAPPPPPPPPPAGPPELEFRVDWNPGFTGRDVDLHVREPNNEHISAGNPVSATGGSLGGECGCSTGCHAETVSWAEGTSPQSGTYEYWIQLADLCRGDTNGVTYTLEVWLDGVLVHTTNPILLECDDTPVPDCLSEPLTFELG